MTQGRRLARLVRRMHSQGVAGHGTGRYRATILEWGGERDFLLDPHGLELQLDEDDVTLGQTVRHYDRDLGLRVGDALVLLEVGDGDYLAVDVESDVEVTWEARYRDSMGGPITRTGS